MLQRLHHTVASLAWLKRFPHVRVALKRAWCRARDPLSRGLVVQLGDLPVRIPLSYDMPEWHLYEAKAVAAVTRWLRTHPDAWLVDVGASHGFYGLVALNASPRARVLAFDSDLTSLRTALDFCRHVDTRRLDLIQGYVSTAHQTPHHLAAAIEQTRHRIAAARGPIGIEFITYRNLDGASEAEIPTYSLDALVLPELPAGTDALVKIDIEGGELLALRGVSRLLLERRPTLLVSVHPQFLPSFGESSETVAAFLREHGYTWTLLDRDHEEHWWCEPEQR